MNRTSTPPGKNHEIRCPRLGHPVYFSYCRSENRGLPCHKTLDCWYEHFLVEDHLRAELTPEEWTAAFENPPKPKLISLVEMIEAAKRRTQKGS